MPYTKKHKRIHILLIVRWPVGGIRTFLRYVYSRFEKDRYKLTIILPITSELKDLQDNLSSIDIQFITLAEFSGSTLFIVAILKALWKRKIDLIHSHGLTSCVFAFLPARFFDIPHLFTSHDVFNEKQFRGIKGKIKKIMLFFVLRKVNCIHSVSYDAQNNLLFNFPKIKTRKEKLIVIPNGVEIERFLINEKIDWRKELGLAEGTFLIGFFGRFMAQKGFRYLVEAIELIAKKTLLKHPLVLTFGWGGFIREEQEMIAQKGLADFFFFLPFQENIATAVRGVDVVAMPSLWEACPLQPMEAMIVGIPVIGTDCIGLREVLKNTPAIMVSPKDPKALSKALLKEMYNPSKKMAENFVNIASERFDVFKQATRLQDEIFKLINRKYIQIKD